MGGLHLIYLPGDPVEGMSDRILDIVETDDVNDMIMEVKANPVSVAMELEAEDYEELPWELQQLGF